MIWGEVSSRFQKIRIYPLRQVNATGKISWRVENVSSALHCCHFGMTFADRVSPQVFKGDSRHVGVSGRLGARPDVRLSGRERQPDAPHARLDGTCIAVVCKIELTQPQ